MIQIACPLEKGLLYLYLLEHYLFINIEHRMKKLKIDPQKEKITLKDIINWLAPIAVAILTLVKVYLK